MEQSVGKGLNVLCGVRQGFYTLVSRRSLGWYGMGILSLSDRAAVGKRYRCTVYDYQTFFPSIIVPEIRRIFP